MPCAPKRLGAHCVARRIGIGHHLEPRRLVGPFQQGFQLGAELGFHGGDLAGEHMARSAVDGDGVALVQQGSADTRNALAHIDDDCLATRHAGFAHAARHHRRMGRLAATAGENTGGGKKAMDVLGLGLLAHQDHAFALAAADFRRIGVENDTARRCPRGSRQALRQRRHAVARRQRRHQQLFQRRGMNARQRLFPGNQVSARHFDRGAHHGLCIHFAITGLQAVETAALDGEFEILHLVVMALRVCRAARPAGGTARASPAQARRSASACGYRPPRPRPAH